LFSLRNKVIEKNFMAPVLPNYNSNKYELDESSFNNYNEQQSIHEPRDKTSILSEDWVSTLEL